MGSVVVGVYPAPSVRVVDGDGNGVRGDLYGRVETILARDSFNVLPPSGAGAASDATAATGAAGATAGAAAAAAAAATGSDNATSGSEAAADPATATANAAAASETDADYIPPQYYAPTTDPLPPRLFVLRRDGSGAEIFGQQEMADYRARLARFAAVHADASSSSSSSAGSPSSTVIELEPQPLVAPSDALPPGTQSVQARVGSDERQPMNSDCEYANHDASSTCINRLLWGSRMTYAFRVSQKL
jgi:hypothetical protein